MSQEQPLGEKTRTCPSCRMMISILATKCRYCGESVGKPKEEARKLSINDLGGENIQHRALSNSVMDALESFRIEDAKDGSTDDGLGGIDDLNTDAIDSDTGDSYYNKSPLATSPTGAAQSSSSSGMDFGLIAKIAAVIIVIGAAAVFVPGFLQDKVEEPSDARQNEYVNRAPSILQNSGDSIAALEAAVAAMDEEPGAENTKIADDIMTAVIKDIEAQLNAESWTPEHLAKASSMATAAARLLPGKRAMAIKEKVNAEQAAYSMNLVRVDGDAGTATFNVTPGGEQMEFSRGDTINDRFVLKSLVGNDAARLEDTKRDGRSLEWRVARGVR